MNISSTPTQSFFSPVISQQFSAHSESPLSTRQGTSEQAEIAKLRKRDQEVRTHEQAHMSAAGGLVRGGATFSYQRGPDGKQYAVGGEVNIDTSPVAGNPEATIQKAQKIRAAALAPANPSAQDRAVAASAATLEAQAQQELKKNEEEALSTESSAAASISSLINLFI